MARPVLTSPRNPSARKAIACAEMARRAAGEGGPVVRHVLFLADAIHMENWGRPLYGETWIREGDDHYVVRGIILSAVGGRERRAIPYEVSEDDLADWLSRSDVEAIGEAAARLAEGSPAEVLRATALHGEARSGFVDYAALLPATMSEERMHDEAWMMAHTAY